jgi:hypothetical protein
MSDKFNFRNPDKNEVTDMYAKAKAMRQKKLRYKMLQDLLDGKTVDMTKDAKLFEALNHEKMEFEELLKLHPEQANESILAAKEDRESIDENIYWNRNSPAKWAKLGHIPPCCYHARPPEYWENQKLLKAFFNMFTKFRVSTRQI